ncbi:MAG: PilZ domain-containing protein [Desulfovermiculus sp.]
MSTHPSGPDTGTRKRSRVKVTLEVIIAWQNQTWIVYSENISLKGILCTFNPGLEVNATCDLRINLSEDVHILVHSKVARATPDRLALDFVKMDEMSFHHLRNLIKLNARDPDFIEHELKYPAFVLSNEHYGSTQKK